MQDTRRIARSLTFLLAATCGVAGAALAQEKPASAPPSPPAESTPPQPDPESDPDAPAFSKPVVYTGGRVIERGAADHVGVSRIGFVKDMQYLVPRGWTKEPPADQRGLAQFRVPAAKDSGIADPVVVFYDQLDGSVHEILDGWLNEVEEPKWTPEIEVWMLDFGYENGLNITLFSGVGTYVGKPLTGGDPVRQPDSMVLGAIIEGSPKGTLYVKAVGHRNVLEPDVGWWQRMVRSFVVTKPPEDYRQPQPGVPGKPTRSAPPPRKPQTPAAPGSESAPQPPPSAPTSPSTPPTSPEKPKS